MRRKTLEDAQKLAELKGGVCLSEKYINSKIKMLWECKRKHVWKTAYGSIYQGSWCPECCGKKKKSLKDAQSLAKSKNGQCLSKKYINNTTKMEWECEKGHRWETSYSLINVGNWCSRCSNNIKNTIDDARKLAKLKNGKCLSSEYVNNKTKMKWECEKGHRWETKYGTINRGRWCPKCVKLDMAKKFRLSLEEVQKVAIEREGKCLSSEYTNNITKMKWECKEKHKWETTFDRIRSGSWCPICKNKSQRILFKTLKQLFPNCLIENNYKKFEWLKRNPKTNYRMEIDFFIKNKDNSFSLAIEYDGEQHFYPVCFGGISMKRAEANFKDQKKRDKLKNKLIKQHENEIKYFIRFDYRDKLDTDSVKNKLLKNNILL